MLGMKVTCSQTLLSLCSHGWNELCVLDTVGENASELVYSCIPPTGRPIASLAV